MRKDYTWMGLITPYALLHIFTSRGNSELPVHLGKANKPREDNPHREHYCSEVKWGLALSFRE